MAIQSVVNVNSGQTFSSPSNDVATANRAAAPVASQPVAVQLPGATSETAASVEELHQAAAKINQALHSLTTSSLEFLVDQDSGRTIVRVVDVATKDVIRQIPNEETLAIAKSLDKFQGLLIRHKA